MPPLNEGTCARCGETKKIKSRGMCTRCIRALLPRITCERCERVGPQFSSKSTLCVSCHNITKRRPDAAIYGSEEHRRRIGRKGRDLRERSGRWSGGRFVTKKGYVRMLPPVDYDGPDLPRHGKAGYVLEHQYVAVTQIIGRSLEPGEVVHHINGDKQDNRPENLQVMMNSEHLKLHNRQWRAEREAAQRSLTFDE